jgi:hypothetical protein
MVIVFYKYVWQQLFPCGSSAQDREMFNGSTISPIYYEQTCIKSERGI